jgi:hypothetical protein
MAQDEPRPETGVSFASSLTNVQPEKGVSDLAVARVDQPDLAKSAVPHDAEGDTGKEIEDDWETHSENARNWSVGKKWAAVAIVCSSFSALRNFPKQLISIGITLHVRAAVG